LNESATVISKGILDKGKLMVLIVIGKKKKDS
jgi:hypothetical protein